MSAVQKGAAGFDEAARSDLFEVIVRSLRCGVVAADADGAIVFASQEVADRFGYPPNDLIGQRLERLLPSIADLLPGRSGLDVDARSQTSPPLSRGGLLARRADGTEFHVEVSVQPAAAEAGAFLLAIVRGTRGDAEWATAFEDAIAELSIQFIDVQSDQIAGVMRAALERLGTVLHVDRIALLEVSASGGPVQSMVWEAADTPSAALPAPLAAHFPWTFELLAADGVTSFITTGDIPNPIDRESYRLAGIRSSVTVGMEAAGEALGAVAFQTVTEERAWTEQAIDRCRVAAAMFAHVLSRQRIEQATERTLSEVRRLRAGLHDENVYLRQEVAERSGEVIVGHSRALQHVLDQVQQVAATDSTVLLLGETGTGKELFASRIHELSARRQRPMVLVNCSAIPSELLESELFGREKGAYTDAHDRQLGRFELADQSSIFLDEVGELPTDVQVKLLRVLEERQIERLGSPTPIGVDTRIIAATHRHLEQRIAEGLFREDLFYRLNVFPIQVPPLRERREDIPLLVWRFVGEFSKTFGKEIEAISRDDMDALQRYPWPGNVRELRNIVERAMIVATGRRLNIPLPAEAPSPDRSTARLKDVELAHIRAVLESTGWRVRGAGGAAERLGVRPTTLETRMMRLGLKRPKVS